MKGNMTDRQIYFFCQQAAVICLSREFKQLHKEMSKIYRKRGLVDAPTIAFQDSLFSMFMEHHDGEYSSQTQYL
ncbi:hypothetical protein [Caldalkalibacillus mannanilyticus]|uniref:hypothetical protein n=1 Tax=Caldalkalibacillus mannanilyticus TaxID=1418 RepID=UPI000468196C|nr:hypothetical protein [Caldalkalibacillus mannanilyticus]